MPNRTRPPTPAQLDLLAKVAASDHGYTARNITEYRKLQALEARGLIEAASWRASYAGQKALEKSEGTAEPSEARTGIQMDKLSAVDRERVIRAATILLKAWERNNPVLVKINDLIKESGMPPGRLFREHPDVLDTLATQLARHTGDSDDDVPRAAAEWRERLLAKYPEPPGDKPKRGTAKE